MNELCTLKTRRGISSVVGALIFTVLMVAGFSALSVAMDLQTDIVNTQRLVSDSELKKQQEQFGVAAFADSNNTLSISVDNNGQNPVEISRIWIINKTLTTQPATPISINPDDALIPSGFSSNVLASQNLSILPDSYDIKVVSTLGTIKTVELTSGSGGLRAEMITDPPDVIIGQNVTVAMVVTNTASTLIENVTANQLTVNPSNTVVSSSSFTPSSVDLSPGESVMFSRDYIINGASGTIVTFSGNATGTETESSNTITSNNVSDKSVLRLPTDGGAGDPDILHDELLARPQIFMVIPGSHGDSSQQALWGINVINPVNATMTVSKLSLTIFAPGANNNDKIVTAGCGPATNLSPTPTNSWTCPTENLVMWENYASPISIPPYSNQAFLARITPGAIAGVNHLESIIVQAAVFTNVGSFGKSGYQTTMYDGADSLGSVYLSKVVDSVSNVNMQINRTGIVGGSTQTFNIVFADLDTDNTTFVKSGGKLVINVPRQFTNVNVVSNPGFSSVQQINHGDGSTQLIGTLAANLGTATNVADTIQFTAVAPTPTFPQMYVMYVLAEGETNTNFSIGPLAEIVLGVD